MKGEGFERERLEREGLKGFVLPNLRTFTFHSATCGCNVKLKVKTPLVLYITFKSPRKRTSYSFVWEISQQFIVV